MTGYENVDKIRPKRTRRQARQNSVTTHKKVCANSFTGELLALLLALFSSKMTKNFGGDGRFATATRADDAKGMPVTKTALFL
jgi:hypothetical protein